MNVLDIFAKEHGFESGQEMSALIASIDLSTHDKLEVFEKWKREDGSKEGLLKLKEKTNAK